MLGREVARFAPDILFNTNGTMITSFWLRRRAVGQGCAYVHWMQDVSDTHAIGYILKRRFGRLGGWGEGLVRRIERDVVANAAGLIVISDDFKAQLAAYGMRPRAVFTIPNWMPCEEITPLPKDNEFSHAHGLAHTFNIIFAGVLGHKHDIAPFVALARACRDLDDLRVVVVGRGFGVERLREVQQTDGLTNLVLVDWQPHERLPRVLAAGDLLMAAIAPQASPSSVPSKILGYLCAGRAVLAVVPEQNLGRRLVEDAGAGVERTPATRPGLSRWCVHSTPRRKALPTSPGAPAVMPKALSPSARSPTVSRPSSTMSPLVACTGRMAPFARVFAGLRSPRKGSRANARPEPRRSVA